MLSAKPSPPRSRRKRGQAAFTVVEVCLATALFAYFAIASVFGMVQVNRMASTARYRTLAEVAAQQRLDQIMTVSWNMSQARPAVLANGTTTENNLPLNNDDHNSATGLASLYTANDSPVTATRVTNIAAVAGNTRLLRVNVAVTYTYAGRNYGLTLVGLRATDDF
jgi:hypothetical protein